MTAALKDDEVPTKRQSGTLWVVRDLATDTARKLLEWSEPLVLVDSMELRHAALAAQGIAKSCNECVAVLETWIEKAPTQEEKKACINRVLVLRDNAQALLASFGVEL